MQGNVAWYQNYRSLLRVAMFHVYGGSDWVNFLLALGGDGINEDRFLPPLVNPPCF